MSKFPQLPAQTFSLADLNPLPGERLRVETRMPRYRFASELIGYRAGGSVLISAPRAGATASRIVEGTRLTIRLMAGNRICAFDSRLLRCQNAPYGYWHLEYPGRVEVQRLRSSARVPVRLRITVDCHDDDLARQGAGFPCVALCTDLSVQGACVETMQPIGQVGDALYLTLRMAVAGIDQVLLAPAVIRNQRPAAVGSGGVFRYGVEFHELEEDGRLLLAGFVYQQFLVETGFIDEFQGKACSDSD